MNCDDPCQPEDWRAFPPSSHAVDLDSLYRGQRHRLLGLFARNGLAEDSADLLHEAFRRMILAVRRLGGDVESPEAYLHRIAQNLAREHGRATERQFIDIDDLEIAGADSLAQLEARDRIDRIEAILATLPPRTREIFLMHRLDGLSYGEIATRMGIGVKGVEKQMAKALFALRRRAPRY
jgi:RNA polymerase sigma factor (sigma-70 family)